MNSDREASRSNSQIDKQASMKSKRSLHNVIKGIEYSIKLSTTGI